MIDILYSVNRVALPTRRPQVTLDQHAILPHYCMHYAAVLD
jgi:hypothetical protein